MHKIRCFIRPGSGLAYSSIPTRRVHHFYISCCIHLGIFPKNDLLIVDNPDYTCSVVSASPSDDDWSWSTNRLKLVNASLCFGLFIWKIIFARKVKSLALPGKFRPYLANYCELMQEKQWRRRHHSSCSYLASYSALYMMEMNLIYSPNIDIYYLAISKDAINQNFAQARKRFIPRCQVSNSPGCVNRKL